MTAVVWVFALLTAGVHLLAFAWEALFLQRPSVHQGIFATPTADVPAIRLWAFGVGFYNFFIACGLIAGVIAWSLGEVSIGRALVVYLCLFTFLSGIVLLVADRMAMSRERGTGLGGALGQSGPPLVALIAVAL
jgi:putative membrane protein